MRKGLAETAIVLSSVLLLAGAGAIASRRPVETIEPIHDFSNIETESTMVYVSETGKRYHLDETCGGMKTPVSLTLEEAEAAGYTPCSVCIGE